MTIKFSLPGLPKVTTNANSNWKARWVEAKKWKRAVENTLVYGQLVPKEPFTKATLTLERFAFGRQPDADNLRSSFKHVVDALVKVGVIFDDSVDVIGEPVCIWHKAKPKQGMITVTVESICE